MSKEYIDDEAIKRIEKITQQESIDKQRCGANVEKVIIDEFVPSKAIDNANPSEALKGLKHIKKYYVPQPCSAKTYDYLEIIEQSLLKAQEQEKENAELKRVLEVMSKKTVSIFQLRCCKNVDEYNNLKFNEFERLTQEEFDLLKRYFKVVKE